MDEIPNRQTIGILPIEGFPLLSYAGVVEPFRVANLLSGAELYNIVTTGRNVGHVESSGPALAKISRQMSNDIDLDYLFVIAGGRPEDFRDPKALNWIARVARMGTCIGGVSGGPVVLAKAGVVAGHRMTVHWEHAPALLESYPDILLEKTLFIKDRQLITCAGGAAALDMTLSLIGQDHGADLMRRVSDWCLHTDIREASGAQRKSVPRNVGQMHTAVLRVVAEMEENIASPTPLSEFAATVGLSPRQLNRVFKRATGQPVMQYYRNMRLEVATSLLRSSALSITQIALATGFAGSSHFSKTFRAHYGTSPSALRA